MWIALWGKEDQRRDGWIVWRIIWKKNECEDKLRLIGMNLEIWDIAPYLQYAEKITRMMIQDFGGILNKR